MAENAEQKRLFTAALQKQCGDEEKERSQFLTERKYEEVCAVLEEFSGARDASEKKAVDSWRGMPEVGLREAMRVVSAVGGQGLVYCACKGECNNNRCACVKAKRKCNSRCHKGSKNCRNHD